MDPVRIFVIHREKVVNVAVIRVRPSTEAHADAANGMSFQRPVDYVQIVDVLFDDVIAAQPGEVVPVPHLPNEIRPFGFTRYLPEYVLVPVTACGDDVADGTLMNAFDSLDIGSLMAALRSSSDVQALLLRFLVGGQHLANAGGIGGDGLFRENVLAGGDGSLEMERTKTRRGRQHDVVRATLINELVVGVQADVTSAFHIDAVSQLLSFFILLDELFDMMAAAIQPVLKGIGQSHDADALGRLQYIFNSPCAATAAADKSHLDHIAAGRVNAGKTQLRGHGGASRYRRRFQEIAPRGAAGAIARIAHVMRLLVPWDRSSRGRTIFTARGMDSSPALVRWLGG